MSDIKNLNFPDDLLYTKDHEWIKKTNGNYKMGVTDFAQDQLGDVVYVELPEKGKAYKMGDELCSVESVKAVSEIYMPVSGKVFNVNEKLKDSPELINSDPYNEGFICEIEVTDENELSKLLNKDKYVEMIKGQIE
jgi:glycine cleavage system H protein